MNLDVIEEAFSVEALTKQFYKELFEWYQWAASDELNVYYPNLCTASDPKQALQEHLIRFQYFLNFHKSGEHDASFLIPKI